MIDRSATPASGTTWILLTGEYSPQPGGVADYTFGLANALGRRGDVVHVIAADGVRSELPHEGDVRIHRLENAFAAHSLPRLEALVRSIRRRDSAAILLVQYVPHAFGRRGGNVPFAAWLAAQRNYWVLFHEVAFSGDSGRPWAERFLSVIQVRMARCIAQSATRVFVTVPAWSDRLRSNGVDQPIEWLPVPSSIPDDIRPDETAAARRRWGDPTCLVGHFGTFGSAITEHLEPTLCDLTRNRPDATVLLVGRGGAAFLDDFQRRHPDVADRVHATGGLDPREVAVHLSACDLLVQPYPDGVSCRRTTAMAGLALGRPVVTNLGSLSEEVWSEDKSVHLATSAARVGKAAAALLEDPDERARLGAAARRTYASEYSLECLVRRLVGGQTHG